MFVKISDNDSIITAVVIIIIVVIYFMVCVRECVCEKESLSLSHTHDANIHWRRKWGEGGGGGNMGAVPPSFLIWGGGGAMVFLCHPPHFYFPLELYVYITLTNNYLAFFIYQLIILRTISIN